MARLAGVDLPREKRLEIALTYIYGIGRTRSKQLIAAAELNADTRVKDLSDDDLAKLRVYIEENFKVEGDLRREVNADIVGRSRSGATRAFAGVADCPSVVSAPRPTHAPARVRRRRSPARRRLARSERPGQEGRADGRRPPPRLGLCLAQGALRPPMALRNLYTDAGSIIRRGQAEAVAAHQENAR